MILLPECGSLGVIVISAMGLSAGYDPQVGELRVARWDERVYEIRSARGKLWRVRSSGYPACRRNVFKLSVSPIPASFFSISHQSTHQSSSICFYYLERAESFQNIINHFYTLKMTSFEPIYYTYIPTAPLSRRATAQKHSFPAEEQHIVPDRRLFDDTQRTNDGNDSGSELQGMHTQIKILRYSFSLLIMIDVLLYRA